MPQTILAFLAILMLTTLTLSQRDSKLRAYRARVGSDIELLAHGVGIGTIEMIAGKPFDEATKGGHEVNGPDDFTGPSFPSEDSSAAHDDLDDFHGAQLMRTFEGVDDTTMFSVAVEIHYLNDVGQRVDQRTYNKEIEVTVKLHESNNEEFAAFSNPVTLKRPVAYAPN